MKKLKTNQKRNDKNLRVSPAARKIASEKKIDIQSIKGSGKNGLSFKRRCNEFNGS